MNFLDADESRIVMFCGKGGVGKTTSAAATALHFADKGTRTLLISTDPMPSISDILECDVRGEVAAIEGIPKLDAVELDYDIIVDLWKKKFGEEVYEVVSSFLPVDKDIIDYVAEAPGIDEEFALSYIYDLYKSGRYEIIVWDTAPAGGTLSLIKLQDKFYRHLGEAAKLYSRVRIALETLIKGRTKRDPLEIISEWEKLSKNVLSMLEDQKTKAILVTIPEALGVNQTERVAKELERYGIHICGLIVNFMLTGDAMEGSDFNRKRGEMQKVYFEKLAQKYSERIDIVPTPLLPFEVRGVDALRELEKLLFKKRLSLSLG
ncbi:ArsA family ATPase [Candidatus Bathyarchaeota archaeon]|nr:ArsA family ATPase [Candidatus Bathyarchaeota archaeon]